MAVAALGQLFVEEPPRVWGSRSVDCFKRLEHIDATRMLDFKVEEELRLGNRNVWEEELRARVLAVMMP
ncbi:hypothetical protein Patl1_27217 [Pistacia atlantica]|uniref:Uncharacterized protein n=1 Tax=Pistacia atlantica TaxID=434234 RepID=A0ACC1BE26_9ROSI|nr:hypothetical protein Patl1_27217 [Pistacia atlantica]